MFYVFFSIKLEGSKNGHINYISFLTSQLNGIWYRFVIQNIMNSWICHLIESDGVNAKQLNNIEFFLIYLNNWNSCDPKKVVFFHILIMIIHAEWFENDRVWEEYILYEFHKKKVSFVLFHYLLLKHDSVIWTKHNFKSY